MVAARLLGLLKDQKYSTCVLYKLYMIPYKGKNMKKQTMYNVRAVIGDLHD